MMYIVSVCLLRVWQLFRSEKCKEKDVERKRNQNLMVCNSNRKAQHSNATNEYKINSSESWCIDDSSYRYGYVFSCLCVTREMKYFLWLSVNQCERTNFFLSCGGDHDDDDAIAIWKQHLFSQKWHYICDKTTKL